VIQKAYAIKRDKTELGKGQGVQKENGNKKRKWEAHPTSGMIRIPPYGNYCKRHKEAYRFDSGVCFFMQTNGAYGNGMSS